MPDAPESVHLCDWPVADPELIDRELSTAVRAVQRLTSLGRAARARPKASITLWMLQSQSLETFILEGSHEVYGARMRLAFVKWMRAQIRFDDLDSLQAQMKIDVAAAADLFAQMTM